MPRQAPKRLLVQLPPFTVIVDNCLVHVLEVLRHNTRWGTEYTVALRVECGAVSSRVFNLTVRNEKELKAKILAEVTKLRLMKYVYGKEFTQEVVGGKVV